MISVSDTVNQDGMYFQNSCCHSFSGDANQNGCAKVPIRLVIMVAPEMVEAMVTMTYIARRSTEDRKDLLTSRANRKLSVTRKKGEYGV